MAQKSPDKSLRALFTVSGRSVEIAVPLIVAVLSVLGQSFLTHYFDNLQTSDLLTFGASMLIVIIAELVIKRYSRGIKILQYGLLYLAVYGTVLVFLPIPNPYLPYFILLNMMMYFQFGTKIMLAGLAIGFFALLAKFIHVSGLSDTTDLGVFLVNYTSIALATYYSIKFVKYAKDELVHAKVSLKEAQAERNRLKSLINNIADGVITLDGEFIITHHNEATNSILELKRDIIGSSLVTLVKLIDANDQKVNLADLLIHTDHQVINKDLRIEYRDNSKADLSIAIDPIHSSVKSNTHTGYTIVVRDITREKSLEAERDEFISVVSHELRTPIAISEGSISNAMLIQSRAGDPKKIAEIINKSHEQILLLAAMVNDISTLSEAQQHDAIVDVAAIDIPTLSGALVTKYQTIAAAKGITFTVKLEPGLSTLKTSQRFLNEILDNLLSNAVKYTTAGSVKFSVTTEGRCIRFDVTDTGAGIRKGDKGRVFDKFFRSEDFHIRETGGLGIGLFVVDKLAQTIHAKVKLDSTFGKGSTFSIIVPDYHIS